MRDNETDIKAQNKTCEEKHYDLRNNLIFRYLNILDKLNSIGRSTSDLENNKHTYEEKVTYIKSLARDNKKVVELDDYLEYTLREFLLDIEIPQKTIDINELTGIKLLKYIIKIIDTIQIKTSQYNQSLIVLKYNKQINETGFHRLSRVCRGKVVNTATHEIIQYPYDKFFNIDENAEYKLENIKNKLDNASYIQVTEKVDGCLVAVTQKFEKDIEITESNIDKLIIQTMGQFDNDQVQIAKSILIKHKSIIKPYRTYIFELITPSEKHVVDYGNIETLILTGIRDLKTYNLLKHNQIKHEQTQLNLPVVEQYEYKSIDDFIEKASKEQETSGQTKLEHEGWVFRLDNQYGETFMFKLKYREYFRLSRSKANISPEKLFITIKSGKYNDYLNQVQDIDIESIQQLREELDIEVEKAIHRVFETGQKELDKINISLDDFIQDKQKRATAVKHLRQLDNGQTIIKVLSKSQRLKDAETNIDDYYQVLKYENIKQSE